MRSTCRYCQGTRMYIKHKCIECEGKGSTVQRRTITVPVPAGKNGALKLFIYLPFFAKCIWKYRDL